MVWMGGVGGDGWVGMGVGNGWVTSGSVSFIFYVYVLVSLWVTFVSAFPRYWPSLGFPLVILASLLHAWLDYVFGIDVVTIFSWCWVSFFMFLL